MLMLVDLHKNNYKQILLRCKQTRLSALCLFRPNFNSFENLEKLDQTIFADFIEKFGYLVRLFRMFLAAVKFKNHVLEIAGIIKGRYVGLLHIREHY